MGQVATNTTLYSIYRALTLIVRGRLLLAEHSTHLSFTYLTGEGQIAAGRTLYSIYCSLTS